MMAAATDADAAAGDVAGHTPGPWRVNRGRKVFAESSNANPVAFCDYQGGSAKGMATAKANAALIARAPEMAATIAALEADNRVLQEALKLLVKEWEDSRLSSDGFVKHLRDDVMPTIRAALASGEAQS